MKVKVAGLVAVVALLGSVMGIAYAAGNTPSDLSANGWSCINAGVTNWIHCFPPSVDLADIVDVDITNNPASLQVKVFDDVAPNPFLGTELLIREDLYHGQPCPTDELGEYEPLDLNGDTFIDYYACHHFETGHH